MRNQQKLISELRVPCTFLNLGYRKHQEHGGDWKEDFERQEEQIARKEEHILQEDKEAEDQQEDQ